MTMFDFIDELLKECPDDLMKGTSATAAAAHLFTVSSDSDKLDEETATLYHHLTAKLLYPNQQI